MALSDLILRLGNQARELADSAAALGADDDAKVKERAATLHRSLEQLRSTLDGELDTESLVAADRMAKMRLIVTDHFDSLRANGAARAERDTEDVVEFALHAIQEVEYHLLSTAGAGNDVGEEPGLVRPSSTRADPPASAEPRVSSTSKSRETTKSPRTKSPRTKAADAPAADGSKLAKQHTPHEPSEKSPASNNAIGA